MNIFQRLQKVWAWLEDSFESLETSGISVAITITENIKAGLDGSLAGFLAQTFDQLAHTKVAETALTTIKLELPKLLATEFAVQGLGVNPTEADFLAFENRILAAFKISADRSKNFTVISAQVYGILHQLANKGATMTFAEKVTDVEDAFQAMMADLNDDQTTAG